MCFNLTMAEDWKAVGDIFTTESSILEVGEFTGTDDDNKPSTVKITDEDVEELYNNIKEPLPFIIKHNGNNKIVGYATNFSRDGDKIIHKGLIHDSVAFKKAVVEGNCRGISPEIDYLYKDGKVVGKKITRLAFEERPAIANNTTEVTRFYFSAPEVNMTGEVTEEKPQETKTTPEPVAPQTPPAIDISALTEAITAGITKKFEEQIGSLKSEIETLKGNPGKDFFTKSKKPGRPAKAKQEVTDDEFSETTEQLEPVVEVNPVGKEVFDEYAKTQLELQKKNDELLAKDARLNEMLQAQYNDILTELENRNIDTERAKVMVKDFKIEDKIKALKAYRAEAMKEVPMISSTQNLGVEGGNQETKQPTAWEVVRKYGDLNNPYLKRIAENMNLELGV